MKHLRPRQAKKARRPGPLRTAGRGRLLPRPPRDRDAPAPAFDPPRVRGRHLVFLLVVLASLGGYLLLCLGMNCCFPFRCG